MSTAHVLIHINGVAHSAEVALETTLVEFVRDVAGLTGTHVGCSHEARCGACTVLVDGRAVKSCTLLAVQADATDVQTVEGMASREELHPLQAAFREHHALQCGFCTPGMLMTACDLLRSRTASSRQAIREGLGGNICRCTGYGHIVDAIEQVAAEPSSGDGHPQPLAQGDHHG